MVASSYSSGMPLPSKWSAGAALYTLKCRAHMRSLRVLLCSLPTVLKGRGRPAFDAISQPLKAALNRLDSDAQVRVIMTPRTLSTHSCGVALGVKRGVKRARPWAAGAQDSVAHARMGVLPLGVLHVQLTVRLVCPLPIPDRDGGGFCNNSAGAAALARGPAGLHPADRNAEHQPGKVGGGTALGDLRLGA